MTTRFYSPTSVKRVLKGESHPFVSLQADAALIEQSVNYKPGHNPASALTPGIVEQLKAAEADPAAPVEIKHAALRALMAHVGQTYQYRLPDATSRKDIEYYRDPAHRGYLRHTVKDGESPSLFFKMPGEARNKTDQSVRKAAAKASAENRLF